MNRDIKALAYVKGVTQKMIAVELGMVQETLCRKMSKELSPEFKEQFLAVVEKLAKKRNGIFL